MHSTGVCSLRESDWCERVLNKSALPQLLSVAAAPAVAATHRANAGPRTIKKKKPKETKWASARKCKVLLQIDDP